MLFVAESHNQADPTPYLAAEAKRMDELVSSGSVQEVFLKADYSGAILVLDAADAGTARSALDSLPLVRHGVTHFSVVPVVTPADLAAAG